MELQVKPVTKKMDDYSKIKTLFKEAFPKSEQISISYLRLLSIRKGVNFTAYYDDDNFCGFTYSIVHDKTVFILYLAVSSDVQSKGYGSYILSHFKNEFLGYEIVLNIEPLIESTDNYSQRLKRFSFYERNGFYCTGKLLLYDKEQYLILSTKKDFCQQAYKQIFKKLSFGLKPISISEVLY